MAGIDSIKPPQNVEAEKSVLASCMHSEPVLDYCCDVLTEEHFYDRGNRKIWHVLKEIHGKGYDFDLLQVAGDEKLKGLEGYLAEVYSVTATSLGVDAVKNKTKRLDNRKLQRDALSATYKALSAISSDDDHEHKTERILSAVGAIGEAVEKNSGLRHVKEIIPEANRHLERVLSGELVGTKTGIKDFDDEVGGLFGGESLLISGRPGDGKTTYLTNMAVSFAEQGERVGIFSIEMQGKKIVVRLACKLNKGKFNNSHMRGSNGGSVTKAILEDYQESMEKLSGLEIYIDDSPNMSPAKIRSSIRSFIRKNKLTALMVDHFSLLGYDGKNLSGKAYEKKDEIARDITRITKEFDLITVEAVQLGRDAQNRRPRLSDLTDTKALEEGANFVLMIYNPIHDDRERRVLCCEKGRDGGMGDYYTNFDGAGATTSSMDQQEKEDYYHDIKGA